MNKYRTYFYSKNKFYLSAVGVTLLIMLNMNGILNFLILVFLVPFSLRQIYDFDMTRYKLESDEERKELLLSLLPIDKKKYNQTRLINACIWCLILFVASLFFALSDFMIENKTSYVTIFTNFIVCMLPFLLELFDIYLKQTTSNFFNIQYVFTVFWLTTSALIDNSEKTIQYFIISLFTLLLVSLVHLFVNRINENTTYQIDSKIKYVNIHRISSYLLTKKKIDEELPIVLLIAFTQSYLYIDVGVASCIMAAFLIYRSMKNYFEQPSYLQLLPLSLKEKKITSHIFTILKMTGFTCILYGLAVIFNRSTYSGFFINFQQLIISCSLNMMMYSFYNVYYHKKDSTYFFLYLIIFTVFFGFYKFFEVELLSSIYWIIYSCFLVSVSFVILLIEHKKGTVIQ